MDRRCFVGQLAIILSNPNPDRQNSLKFKIWKNTEFTVLRFSEILINRDGGTSGVHLTEFDRKSSKFARSTVAARSI